MSSIKIKGVCARRMPDPQYGETAQRIFLTCRIMDIPTGIPSANVREQNTDKRIYRDVAASLRNETGTAPNTFHLKNRGLLIFAKDAQSSGKDCYEVDCPVGGDDGQIYGIGDGGHTYRIIQQELEAVADVDDECNPLAEQYVDVLIFVGYAPEVMHEVAETRNIHVAVDELAIADHGGKFDWIKGALEGMPYYDQIQWTQNAPGVIGADDIIALLDLFNIDCFPNERQADHPRRAYVSKGQVLRAFVANPEPFCRLEKLLPDVLRLRDHVIVTARQMWNEQGGIAGRLSMFQKLSPARRETAFPFSDLSSDYMLHRGALYPMLAAFRFMVERKGQARFASWKGNFDDVLGLWDELGVDMLRATRRNAGELGNNINALGKSPSHYRELHMEVMASTI